MKSRLNLNILNTSFTVTSDQDEAYFRKVVEFYSNLVDQAEKTFKTKDPMKIAIVAGLLAVDYDPSALLGKKKNDGRNETETTVQSPVESKDDKEIQQRLNAIIQKLDAIQN